MWRVNEPASLRVGNLPGRDVEMCVAGEQVSEYVVTPPPYGREVEMCVAGQRDSEYASTTPTTTFVHLAVASQASEAHWYSGTREQYVSEFRSSKLLERRIGYTFTRCSSLQFLEHCIVEIPGTVASTLVYISTQAS